MWPHPQPQYNYLALLLLGFEGCTPWVSDLEIFQSALHLIQPPAEVRGHGLKLLPFLQLLAEVSTLGIQLALQTIQTVAVIDDDGVLFLLSWSSEVSSYRTVFLVEACCLVVIC